LGDTLESLMSMAHLRITPILHEPPDAAKAEALLAEEFAKYHAARALEAEMAEALEDLEGADAVSEGDPRLVRRLNHAVQTRLQAGRSTASETGGLVSEDTAALSQGLRALIEGRAWEKKSR
jgi:DNA primase